MGLREVKNDVDNFHCESLQSSRLMQFFLSRFIFFYSVVPSLNSHSNISYHQVGGETGGNGEFYSKNCCEIYIVFLTLCSKVEPLKDSVRNTIYFYYYYMETVDE